MPGLARRWALRHNVFAALAGKQQSLKIKTPRRFGHRGAKGRNEKSAYGPIRVPLLTQQALSTISHRFLPCLVNSLITQPLGAFLKPLQNSDGKSGLTQLFEHPLCASRLLTGSGQYRLPSCKSLIPSKSYSAR